MYDKRCSRCGENKPLAPISAFHRNRSNQDGWADWCKECALAHATTRNRYRPTGRERRVAEKFKDTVRRQSLFSIEVRRARTVSDPEFASCFWYKFWNPDKREAARLEYERLLAPPPVIGRSGTRIDI